MEFKTDVAPEICARDYKSPLCIVEGGAWGFDPNATRDVGDLFLEETAKTLAPGSCPGYHDGVVIKEKEMDCTNCDKGCKLVVRRLTPVECGRLQAMPDWWLTNLAIEDPSEEDIAFWLDAWNTWQGINGKPKKNEKFIRKWLNNPYADSSAYKLYGNGMCFANCLYVLGNISAYANGEL